MMKLEQSSSHVYSVDSDLLISSWNTYFRPVNFPGFWQKLKRISSEGRLFCAKAVYDELSDPDDDLFHWLDGLGSQSIISYDAVESTLMNKVYEIDWHQNLANPYDLQNASAADPWVIAVACQLGASVLTHEGRKGKKGSQEHPKIPLVCESMSIPCIDVWQLVSREEWVFS